MVKVYVTPFVSEREIGLVVPVPFNPPGLEVTSYLTVPLPI
jgi:hypothetical protein